MRRSPIGNSLANIGFTVEWLKELENVFGETFLLLFLLSLDLGNIFPFHLKTV